jgi:integrase
VARYRTDEGKQKYDSLGELQGYPINEQFEIACEKAREWFINCRGGMTEVVTVKTACDEYLKDLRLRKGESAEKTAKVRINAHIQPKLGSKRIDKLSLTILTTWRDGLVDLSGDKEKERASKNSANRTTTVLKAALNLAAKRHKIIDRTAWGDLKPISDVAGVRDIYLTDEQKKRLLETATGSLLILIKAGFLTGARLGELTNTKAADFDARQGTLRVYGKTKERHIVLSHTALEFFKEQKHGKLPQAWLLPRDDGKQWDRHFLSKRFREVAKEAKLPKGSVFYVLRHWYISEALKAKVDIELLARNVGNSATIIRKHYHKFLQDDVRDEINKLQVTCE